jgi:hypothetical protein
LKRSSSVTISPKYLSILRTTNLERRTLWSWRLFSPHWLVPILQK